jgi:glutamyl-tRNA synthetase
MNWLFARKYGGKFLLRIEDTDQVRSKDECTNAILEGLSWLDIDHVGPVIMQSENISRHAAIAKQLLDQGKAYRCYCTPQNLDNLRQEQLADKRPPRYDRRCRTITEELNKPFAIRLKVPAEMEWLEVDDIIKGKVRISKDDLDDLIMLRSDGFR